MSDAVDRLAQALSDLINEAVQAVVLETLKSVEGFLGFPPRQRADL